MIEKIIKGIKYCLNEETMTAEVLAKRNGYEGDIIIPETVVFKKVSYLVTNIDEHAFYNCKSLISITIPDSVTSIGEGAFESCSSLKAITISNSVKSIGEWAYAYCRSMTDITFQGTIAQWKKITLRDSWKHNIPATVVHCTDGDVEI